MIARQIKLKGSCVLGLVLWATAAPSAAEMPWQPPPAQGNGDAQRKPAMAGPEMLEQGREYRNQIEGILLQIQAQVEQAKSDKDIIRLNCLLDKQTQVKVNGNIMDQALQTLQDMLMRRNLGAVLHEYTRVTIINQKVQVLRTEADACVGAETNYVGPTKVFVEVPPGLHNTADQPAPSEPPVVVVDRPTAGSPSE